MKRKKLFQIFSILFISILLLCSCDYKQEKTNPLVGEWIGSIRGTDGKSLLNKINFKNNDTFTYIINVKEGTANDSKPLDTVSGQGTYRIEETKVIFQYQKISGSIVLPNGISGEYFMGIMNQGDSSYTFSIKGNELSLISEQTHYELKFLKTDK